MNFKLVISAIFASAIAVAGCSSDGGGGAAGTGGDGGSGGIAPKDCDNLPETTGYSIEGAPPTSSDDCTVELDASGMNDAQKLIVAIEQASSGDTICLKPGTYDMDQTVFVSDKLNLTIKGIGASPDDVKADWKLRGDRGFDVTANGFHIESMWIVNTKGNGVEIKAEDGTFKKLLVTWDAGSVTANGAYGVYPTSCKNTKVEYNEVIGASDAGVYVGQCEGGDVHHNKVHGNVAGLEVENCADVEAYENEIYDNAGGLLPLQEPGLQRLKNERVRMYDNLVYCNNRNNFAKLGSTVSGIPSGTGAMSFAGDGIEIFDNYIQGNDSFGVLIVSNVLLCLANCDPMISGQCEACPTLGQENYNPYAINTYVHDNTYVDNGTSPKDLAAQIALAICGAPPPCDGFDGYEDVVWGGFMATADEDPGICLGDPVDVSYRDLTQNQCKSAGGVLALGGCVNENTTTDSTGRDCEPSPE